MCNPLAAAAGIGVVQSTVGFLQKNAAYKAEQSVYRQNAALAETAADLELRGIRGRQLQERESATQQILAIGEEVMRRRGAALAGAAEGGVGLAGSVVTIDRDFTKQGLSQGFGIERNLAFTEEQLNREAVAARQRQQARVLSALPTMPAPSFLEPILGSALAIGESQLMAPEGSGFLGLGGTQNVGGGTVIPEALRPYFG